MYQKTYTITEDDITEYINTAISEAAEDEVIKFPSEEDKKEFIEDCIGLVKMDLEEYEIQPGGLEDECFLTVLETAKLYGYDTL